MKISKRAISRFHLFLIMTFLLILAPPVYSFTTGTGIFGKMDIENP